MTRKTYATLEDAVFAGHVDCVVPGCAQRAVTIAMTADYCDALCRQHFMVRLNEARAIADAGSWARRAAFADQIDY